MMIAILVILGLYAGMMLIFSTGLIALIYSKPKEQTYKRLSVSVVIPVRNESKHLPLLLESLNFQDTTGQSFEVIIVDDYSDDGTLDAISEISLKYQCTIISLQTNNLPLGKKSAITTGVKNAKNPIIIVTDADCLPGQKWISSYSTLFSETACRMAAGLVKYHNNMKPATYIETLDFYGMVAASAGAAGLGFPFMCNAANMAFLRDSFLEINGFHGHQKISSGDDVFLLHQFIETFGRESVKWNLHPESTISTFGSERLADFISQRIRWASKSRYYRNPVAIIVSLLVLLSNLVIITAVPVLIIKGNWFVALGLFSLKAIADFPLILIILARFRQLSLLWWFIPSTLIYPLYTGIIGLLSLFFKTKWKGRSVIVR